MRRIALFSAICAATLVWQAPLHGQFNAALRPREEQQVRQWYNDYLGREVGPELKAWTELLKSGMSPLDVQATILGSDEFFNQKGRDTQSFVIETLQSVNWEEPTVSDLRRWTDRLTVLRGDRFALAREILLANDQAGGGTTPVGPNLSETAARLSTAAKLLVDTIDFEIGGTQQGRQANLKAQALWDSTEQLRRTVGVTGYRPTEASLAVQNVERSLTALQSTLNSPAGTAPGAAGIARRVGTMIDELEVALRPAVTQPRPLPGTPPAPSIGPTAEKLLVQAQSASRGVESIIQSLTGQAYQNYGTSVVLRDLDTFAAALEELQTSIRRGSSRDRVQWEIESLAAQAVRIGPQLRGSQMPPFTRLFWSSVESSLEQMAETLGITDANSTRGWFVAQ